MLPQLFRLTTAGIQKVLEGTQEFLRGIKLSSYEEQRDKQAKAIGKSLTKTVSLQPAHAAQWLPFAAKCPRGYTCLMDRMSSMVSKVSKEKGDELWAVVQHALLCCSFWAAVEQRPCARVTLTRLRALLQFVVWGARAEMLLQHPFRRNENNLRPLSCWNACLGFHQSLWSVRGAFGS